MFKYSNHVTYSSKKMYHLSLEVSSDYFFLQNIYIGRMCIRYIDLVGQKK